MTHASRQSLGVAALRANNSSLSQPVAQKVVYWAARNFVTDLKLRCWVGGVQPVVGMGRVRWKRVGEADAEAVGVDVGEGEVGLEGGWRLEQKPCRSERGRVSSEKRLVVMSEPMKPPPTPARMAMRIA
jgi:hypothetical protein